MTHITLLDEFSVVAERCVWGKKLDKDEEASVSIENFNVIECSISNEESNGDQNWDVIGDVRAQETFWADSLKVKVKFKLRLLKI